jgi:hypothetical protein
MQEQRIKKGKLGSRVPSLVGTDRDPDLSPAVMQYWPSQSMYACHFFIVMIHPRSFVSLMNADGLKKFMVLRSDRSTTCRSTITKVNKVL